MREIKFRGVDVHTGKTVYGSFCRPNGIIPDWNPNIEHTVNPDSVAQLIGVDKNGVEVYEGDKVKRICWHDMEGYTVEATGNDQCYEKY